MRPPSYPALVTLVLVLVPLPRAQAAQFVNLNFEQVMVPPGTPPGTLSAALAFPGWTARLNGFALSEVYYNYSGIGEPQVVLYDSTNVPGLGSMPIMEGAFGAVLIPSLPAISASLEQIGDVPVGTRSIRMLVHYPARVPPMLFVNGIELPLVHLSGIIPLGIAEFGADVESFAGTNVQLRLARNHTISTFDNVTFSPIPIPEPGFVALLWGAPLLHSGRYRTHARRSRET